VEEALAIFVFGITHSGGGEGIVHMPLPKMRRGGGGGERGER